ncbi:MAG TPA: lipase maturation factor family protein [Verrucomicrobiae bacterium]|nr:lipase maturation factor family protein [Verrucomicrobiae bacterium]
MPDQLAEWVRWLLGSENSAGAPPAARHLWARWIFLRALGFIYFSAFYSFYFQIKGLVGPDGILPARDYLQAVEGVFHGSRFWYTPTVFWYLGTSDRALMAVCWIGLAASVLLFLNLWPRGGIFVCFVCFLSFIAVAQDFASYQSDGMLMEAGLLSLFFAPPGLRPGFGSAHGPSRASFFLLQWEWFRIYFQSGVVKLASGDQSWRHFTAMDDYYQNGPLPSWIGWYVQHLPHGFHATITGVVLATELALVWMVFLPRRFRIICFCIITPMQVSIILTGNYAFLNYLVLSLGFLLLDDQFFQRWTPARVKGWIEPEEGMAAASAAGVPAWRAQTKRILSAAEMGVAGIVLGWMFYASSAQLIEMFIPELPLPDAPIRALEPFRLDDRYGLFAVMTHERYEIEFQGSSDGGRTWLAFPFRYKPQNPAKAPGIYAPYQPRFEWNLWFASLGPWQDYRFVVWTEERLLTQDRDVLELFAGDPFDDHPPQRVRAVIYQYWFTDWKTKRETGMWWRRKLLGVYAPELEREPDGKIVVLEEPEIVPEQP